MGMDLMIFGGIGLVSEIGHHIQETQAYNASDIRTRVANALMCNSSFEKEIWEQVCDPQKHNDVWERIEAFKRNNPHLCVGQSRWDFVGKNRLLLVNAGRKTQKMDSIVSENCEKTVALLCRTYGRLSYTHASEVAMQNSFYLCWSALPSKEIYPVWNAGQREVAKLKSTLRASLDADIERLQYLIQNATEEQHDAIVYMTGIEFDQKEDNAVLYIVDKIKRILGISTNVSSYQSDGIYLCTTTEQYNKYIQDGGKGNLCIKNSILRRELREQEAKKKPFPFGVTYVPNGGELPQVMKNIMFANAIINSPEPTIADTMKLTKNMMCNTFFDGSISGFLLLIFGIVAVVSAISSIGKFLGEF